MSASDEDLIGTAEFKELMSEVLVDGSADFSVQFHEDRVELDARDPDLTMTLYSIRENPEVNVKGDVALLTGSRMTVTRDGETRDVAIDGTISWELPAFVVQEEASTSRVVTEP